MNVKSFKRLNFIVALTMLLGLVPASALAAPIEYPEPRAPLRAPRAPSSDETLGGVAAEGNLKITVLDPVQVSGNWRYATMHMARYSDGAWQTLLYRDAFSTPSYKGGRLVYDGGSYRYGDDSDGTNVADQDPTAATNTKAGDTITTVLTLSTDAIMTQTITYQDGDDYIHYVWQIKNISSTTFSNLKFFNFADTCMGRSGDSSETSCDTADDGGDGFWVAASQAAGVRSSKYGGSKQNVWYFQAVTPPAAYGTGDVSTVANDMVNGQLTNNADVNQTDHSYALQWNQASLTSGAVWTIEAYERFTLPPKNDIIVTAPTNEITVTAGITTEVLYAVTNLSTTVASVALTPTVDLSGWTASVTDQPNPATVPATGAITVTVLITVPSGAAIDDTASVTLTGGTASEVAAVRVTAAATQGGLEIGKTAEDVNGAPLQPGDEILYTILVTNSTTSPMTGVRVTDTLPSGVTMDTATPSGYTGPNPVVWDVGGLAASGLWTGTITVTVDSDVSAVGGNVAEVSSDQEDTQSTDPILPPGLIPPVLDDLDGDVLTYTVGDGTTLIDQALTASVTDTDSADFDGGKLTVEIVSGGQSGVDELDFNDEGWGLGNLQVNGNQLLYDVAQTLIGEYNFAGLTLVVTFTQDADTEAATAVLRNVTYNYDSTLAATAARAVQYVMEDGDGGVSEPVTATVNITGGTIPDLMLELTKIALDLNGGGLYEGDEIEYRLMVKNITDTLQTNVVITDAIPANTTYVPGSASVTMGTVSVPDPLVADIGTLAVDEYAVLTFRVTVDDGAGGQDIDNIASADSDQQDPPINVGPIKPQPDPGPVIADEQLLSIRKVAVDVNGAPLYTGDEIEYRVVVENITNTAQSNVVITDAIPANTTYVADSASVTQGSIAGTNPVAANVGTLAAGAQAVLTFRVTVNADADGQTITNQASASSDAQQPEIETPLVEPYPDPLNDFPEEPGGGGPVLDDEQLLAIRKVAVDVNGAPLYTGDEIEYRVVVENITTTAQSNVVITDAIPANTTYVAGSAAVTQGTVDDTGPIVAAVGTLDAGETAVLTFRVTVNADADGQTITNQAAASSDAQQPEIKTPPVEPYPDPLKDFPEEPGGGGPVLDDEQLLAIRKVAVDVNGAPLYTGDEIEYRVVVENITTTAQAGVVITDAIPVNTTYVPGSASVTQGTVDDTGPIVADVGTLDAGETAVLTFRVTVNAGADGQTITNQAAASSDAQQPEIATPPVEPYPDPLKDFPEEPGGGGPVIGGEQLIEIQKTARDLDGNPLYVGDIIEYQVMVRNITTTAQSNVVITDAIPANTSYVGGSASVTQGSIGGTDPVVANIGTLAADAYAILTFRVKVDAGAVGLPITNQAAATSDGQTDPVITDPTPPYPGPNDLPDPGPKPVEPGNQLLGIGKTAEDLDGAPLRVGDTIEYHVVIVNITTTVQHNVVVTDAIPAHTMYVGGSANVTQGNVSGTDPLVANINDLAVGGMVTLTFRVTVTADAVGLPVTNQASATSDEQADPVITDPTPPYPSPYDFPEPGPEPVVEETTVDPPVVTSPISGTAINDPTPTFTGTADAGATVTVTTHPTGTVLCVAVADGNGNWTCTPTTDLPEGETTVGVVAGDSAGNESDPTFVDVSVDTLPPAPPMVTGPISGTVVSDTPTFTGTGEPGGEVNVYDDEGNVVCTTVVNPDGTWSCTPDAPLDEGEQTYDVTVTDEAGNESDPTPVTVTVEPSDNHPPVAVDDEYRIPESVPAQPSSVLAVLVNDSDPDVGDAITITQVSVPGHGTAGISAGGQTVIYTPTADYLGTDTFTYTGSDGTLEDSAQVTVTVLPVADLDVSQRIAAKFSDYEITIVVRNLGPRDVVSPGAVLSDTFLAAVGTTIEWTCAEAGGAVCSNASGSGDLEETLVTFPANSVITYTVTARGGTNEIVWNTVTITPPDTMFDVVPSNNIARRLTVYRMILPLVYKGFTP